MNAIALGQTVSPDLEDTGGREISIVRYGRDVICSSEGQLQHPHERLCIEQAIR